MESNQTDKDKLVLKDPEVKDNRDAAAIVKGATSKAWVDPTQDTFAFNKLTHTGKYLEDRLEEILQAEPSKGSNGKNR